MLLFIPNLLNKNYQALYDSLYIEGLLWIIVIIAISIDLHYGIKKAKQEGEYISSGGLKRTITKFKEYASVLIYAFLGDIAFSPFTFYLPFPLNVIPIVSTISTILLVYTEFKSVREKGDKKVWRQMKNNLEEMGVFYNLLKEKELTNQFFDFIKEKENERRNKEANSQNNE